ncbi:MAG: thioredoxin family protein [Bacteroidetes bacterium]|nr:thioredoxin family protein [Bacteroidota bacterium]
MPSSPSMWFQRVVRPKVFCLLTSLFLVFATEHSLAQSIVNWKLSAEYYGIDARIVLEGQLPSDDPRGGAWRMYAVDSPPPSRALSVQFDSLPIGLTLRDSLKQIGIQSGYDPYFDNVVSYFNQRALVWADYIIDSNFVGGEVTADIEYMICNDIICLPPNDITISSTFVETQDPFIEIPTPSHAPIRLTRLTPPFNFQDLPLSDMEDSTSMWGFILLAIGAGFAALLMPCIYPMIPLTVSYFSNHSKGAPLRLALLYGFSIVGTFTALGVGLSVIMGSAGALIVSANPWVNLAIAIAFLIFGLSLIGVINLRLPSSWTNWFNRKGAERQGYIGVLFMGLALTLVSFTCTAPFIGILLPSIAEGEWFYGIIGMAVFSGTFALPFVGFACFPQALNILPGSGRWMREVAVVVGFIEIAAAVKFFSNADLVWGLGLIDRSLVISLWIVLAALAGLYLIGHLTTTLNTESQRIGAGNLMFGILFFGLAIYLVPGLFGARLGWIDTYLPPRMENTANFFGRDIHQEWITDDLPKAFSEAIQLDQPLFIDFSGYTCTNCRGMEVNVFEKETVSEILSQNFVLSRLYTDGPHGREFQAIQEDITGTVALPTYAIMDGSDENQPITQLSGVVSKEEFETFLRYGLQKFSD